ncbi:hypothetical protein SPRG_20065 [Saprolegnia parasitica CBS 223.65]|uniref:Uncharacterized protein n=1 Tax=Saprolegnia parasitica (strain CBS 223.65) TaxID=695850 RepID=A0A067CEL9_SAPPC|nr:hypothetical protein SPRG_20065 [Saprolegnia parasitica CBS 223.65]KDO28958.1 hypothetical protein SPRG_20065 [Saprolegnia parasitica CBS 223.65]|eukprot:XP_012200298.1 hypothetical protein SPRG_20065 [Saprolegnia parasitica CBS 223.65]
MDRRAPHRCALLWATLSKVATARDDAARTELLVQLLRLEAHVTTYKGPPPKTCLSKVLGDDRVAYMVGLYTTPLVLDYVASLDTHDALYSPVNIAAPAIMQSFARFIRS